MNNREARDIILDGPMPEPDRPYDGIATAQDAEEFCLPLTLSEARGHSLQCPVIAQYIAEMEEAAAMASLPPQPLDTLISTIVDRLHEEDEREQAQRRAAREAQERRDAAQRERQQAELQSQTRRAGSQELAAQLTNYGLNRDIIIRVLYGQEDAINAAARHVRQEAFRREQEGMAPNSHAPTAELLRRRDIPGSEEAVDVANRFGTQAEIEAVARDELREEEDRVRDQARSEYPASTMAILRGLGLQDEERHPAAPDPIGQPVDIPSPQQDAMSQMSLAVRQFLHAYDGDIHFTIANALLSIIGFARDHGVGESEAHARVADTLRDHLQHIDRTAGTTVSSANQEDIPDGEGQQATADSRGTDTRESSLHRREDREYDAPTGRARPSLINF